MLLQVCGLVLECSNVFFRQYATLRLAAGETKLPITEQQQPSLAVLAEVMLSSSSSGPKLSPFMAFFMPRHPCFLLLSFSMLGFSAVFCPCLVLELPGPSALLAACSAACSAFLRDLKAHTDPQQYLDLNRTTATKRNCQRSLVFKRTA